MTNSLKSLLKTDLNLNSFNPAEFANTANSESVVYERGVIESVFLENDAVFATIQRVNGDHFDGLFNVGPGVDPLTLTLNEITILTNIEAANNTIERYKGKEVLVTVINKVAVFAQVHHSLSSLSSVPSALVRRVRDLISNRTSDLFSDLGKSHLKREGLTDEDIEALSKFTYTKDMIGKVNTFKGEAVWSKDTNQKKEGENIIDVSNSLAILPKLKQLGMKSKNCHIPSRLFSGK